MSPALAYEDGTGALGMSCGGCISRWNALRSWVSGVERGSGLTQPREAATMVTRRSASCRSSTRYVSKYGRSPPVSIADPA